jgi:hypothetical protein
LIPKVNRPEFRLIVNSAKSSENDPGSSQGSGLAFEGPPQQAKKEAEAQESEAQASEKESSHPTQSESLSVSEQIDLGNLVREYHESKKAVAVRPGLTTQYNHEDSQSKGLLLNKKVE